MVEYYHMSVGKFFLILGLGTMLCWLAWGAVLMFMTPQSGGLLALLLFYFSLILALLGTFSFIGYLIRILLNKDDLPYKHVKVASRQAVLFTILLVVALLLQSQRFLTWWNLTVLIVLLGFVELFSISYQKYNK